MAIGNTIKLFILPLGTCGNDKEKIFTPGKDKGQWIEVPIWATLIQMGGLNILVDTGMHPVHIKNPEATFSGTTYAESIHPKMREEDNIVNRLKELHLAPEDIDLVINTHLHFDHAGGNCFFTDSTFIVQKEHYQYALNMPETFPPEYYLLPGLNYDLIDGELSLLPGLEIIRCPGHVPGMHTVVVHLEDTGTIVLAGDAISLGENLSENRWDSYWNPSLAQTSARRMEAIANTQDGQLFFGHDPKWWKSVKRSPDCYT